MSDKIRVLVVDDSGFVRAIVSKRLETDPDILVVGTASDGIDALDKVKALRPHVITLDVMMPRMDGLVFLERLMQERPTPVIMLSALTREGADISLKALELGAVDFFLKPSVLNPTGDDGSVQALITKIKTAAEAKVAALRSPGTEVKQRSDENINYLEGLDYKTVVIGTSTGGPKALMQVIPLLPAYIQACILIVQHMPPIFTKSLAERLNDASKVKVREAQPGDKIRPGLALLAPGDYHMVLTDGGRISLHQKPPVWGVRPSVDVTMESVAESCGSSAVGVVLTGMGVDGTRGAGHMKAAGGYILAEDESTCAVYGMPKSLAEAGYADRVIPLPQMAAEITRICEVTAQ